MIIMCFLWKKLYCFPTSFNFFYNFNCKCNGEMCSRQKDMHREESRRLSRKEKWSFVWLLITIFYFFWHVITFPVLPFSPLGKSGFGYPLRDSFVPKSMELWLWIGEVSIDADHLSSYLNLAGHQIKMDCRSKSLKYVNHSKHCSITCSVSDYQLLEAMAPWILKMFCWIICL